MSPNWIRSLSALALGIALICLMPSMVHATDPATASTAMSPEVAACIKHGTDMPEIKNAILGGAGQKDEQSTYIRMYSVPQASECIGETTRKISAKVQIAKWTKHHRKIWHTIGGGEMYRDFPDGSLSESGSGSLLLVPGGHNGLSKGQLVTCLPGPRKRPVRALIEREVTYKATGRTYRKVSPISVRVRGGRC